MLPGDRVAPVTAATRSPRAAIGVGSVPFWVVTTRSSIRALGTDRGCRGPGSDHRRPFGTIRSMSDESRTPDPEPTAAPEPTGPRPTATGTTEPRRAPIEVAGTSGAHRHHRPARHARHPLGAAPCRHGTTPGSTSSAGSTPRRAPACRREPTPRGAATAPTPLAEQAHRAAYAPPVAAPVPSSAPACASGPRVPARVDRARRRGRPPGIRRPRAPGSRGRVGRRRRIRATRQVPLTDAPGARSSRPRQAGRCRGRPVPALRRHRRRRRSARAGPHQPRRHDAARTRAGRHAAPGRIGRQHRRRGAAQRRHDQGRRRQRGFGDGLRLRHRRQGPHPHQQPRRRARRQRRHRGRAEQRRHREGDHRRA